MQTVPSHNRFSTKQGKKHGKETWWQDNGYKSYSANFLDDQLHGKTYNWDDQGYLISSSEFDIENPCDQWRMYLHLLKK